MSTSRAVGYWRAEGPALHILWCVVTPVQAGGLSPRKVLPTDEQHRLYAVPKTYPRLRAV